ncbi:MAG TPA: discoidin domain-containing protein [Candidatus Baltobacteraceae bacterium]|nr:discoidin domain-containing protein [Candidatus Baltobacteraceae bacterium]
MIHAIAALLALVTVRVDTSRPIAVIRPDRAIGSAIDSDPPGRVPFLYSPPRVKQMLASGLGSVSYRLYTELSIQDWHWNPSGTFSDAARQQGYWTSSAALGAPIVDSYGYILPHRGDTRDQGDDNGYSRIDDGDSGTYWKSNPYLSSRYTHEPDSAHPQWVVVDLGSVKSVNAIAIDWMNPYATRYRVEYWEGAGDAILDAGNGRWIRFPNGEVRNEHPGTVLTRLSGAPLRARWVRILMSASSNTCDTHGSSDPRNCVGYAIQDVALGERDGSGKLRDYVVRSKCGGDPQSTERCSNHQTEMWTSSDDPWHTAAGRVKQNQDQPGLDIVSTSGITRGLPMMYAVPLYYSTPENAAAMVRYLEARHYPISYIEMGEEVDGQYAVPEDYAELYLQFAAAIHRIDPRVKLGGPVFEGFNTDLAAWRDAQGRTSWMTRFLDYLKSRGRLGDLAFMSFEHYPFHACDEGDQLQDDLLREAQLIRNMAEIFRSDGLPDGVPMFVTESNFAADGPSEPQRVEGTLWMTDYIASALSSGIAGINYYQYETEPLNYNKRCERWGNYTMFLTDQNYRIRARAASFYGAQMLTQQWLKPGDTAQALYRVTTSLGENRPLITAYAAKRAGGSWSLLFVNKDFRARRIHVERFGPAKSYATFGEQQYMWSSRDASELPAPNLGIAHSSLRAGNDYLLPPRSVSVIGF